MKTAAIAALFLLLGSSKDPLIRSTLARTMSDGEETTPPVFKVGTFNVGTGAIGTQFSVTGLGFRPKCLLMWHSYATTQGVSVPGAQQNFAFSDGSASSGEPSSEVGFFALDGQATTITGHTFVQWVPFSTDGTVTGSAVAPPVFDPDGFTFTVRTVYPTAILVNYLAIGGSAVKCQSGHFTIPFTVGVEATAAHSLGTTPALVIFELKYSVAGFTDYGFASDTVGSQYAATVSTANGAATTTGRQWQSSSYTIGAIGVIANSLLFAGHVSTMNSTTLGVIPDVIGGQPTFFNWFAISGLKAKVGTETLGASPVSSGVPWTPDAAIIASVSGRGDDGAATIGAAGDAEMSISGFTAETTAGSYALDPTGLLDSDNVCEARAAIYVNRSRTALDTFPDTASITLGAFQAGGFTYNQTGVDTGTAGYILFGK